MISFKGKFVIFAAKLKDDSYLLKERLLSHNGEFVSIKGWKNNGGNVVFNGRIVIEPLVRSDLDFFWCKNHFCSLKTKEVIKYYLKKNIFPIAPS